MDLLLQDARHALRLLRRRPGFAAVVVVTLALAIGANSAMFSVIRAVLLEPLPYRAPDRLVMVWEPRPESEVTHLSEREILEYREATTSFDQVAGYTLRQATLTEGSEPARVPSAYLTGNAFATLGVPALLGRAITPDDDAPGAAGVVVLSYRLWQRQFGGSPDLVGGTIRVNGRPRTVIGIMPAGFQLPFDYRAERATELWVPAAIDPTAELPWGSRDYLVFARLRDGVTYDRATADLAAAMRGWTSLGYLDPLDLDREAVPFTELLLGPIRPALLILFGAVGLLLLIACANVGNLLLARADTRRKEMATRAALGAGRARIVRQLLIESGLLAVIGALVGAAVAYAGLKGLLALTPVNVIRQRGISPDLTVLGYTAAVAMGTALLAGLAPALQLSRVNVRSSLTVGGGRGAGAATSVRPVFRQGLVGLQAALAVILVIGASLLAQSFSALRQVDLGFEPQRVLTARLTLPSVDYPETDDVIAFYRGLLDRVRAMPGVRSAGATRILPLSRTIGDWTITVEGRPTRPGENPNGDWQVVTPGYFEAMGMRLTAGRFLTEADDDRATPVAVINEVMARRYWPGEDALGKRFHLGDLDQPWITIVGITPGVRHNAVLEEARAEMYLPHSQFALQSGGTPRGMTLVMKTSAPPLSLTPALRQEVNAMDANLPLSEVRTLEAVTASALAEPRFSTTLLGAFALLALALSAVGLYGVLAFMAVRRTQEVGIRMALGADRLSVLCLFVWEGLLMAGAGLGVGIVGSLALTRTLASQLYGVAPLDPPTFVAVPLCLLGIAALACYLPARRAAALNPLVALREE
jgi:putative ABC transport system permease protein